jgi:GAF domain-containing protein
VAEEIARVVDVSLVSITRYEPDGTATECGSFATEGSLSPVGTRWSLEGTNVISMIRENPEAARINDYSGLQGEIADALRRSGVRSTVGVPIVVAQRLWGVMVVSSREPEPLPESIEPRLAGFTELLAVAIESAEWRDALSRLAEEQTALRRVATLVAQGAPPHELFAAAAKEIERVFGLCPTTSDVATVVRFDPGPESVLVGMSKSIEGLPLESRWEPKDLYVSTRVARTGRSARVDAPELDAVGDPDADALRAQRLFSQVASPIVVDGRLWGAMTINAYERLPADTEERLEKFTELVATAIANSDSRGAVAQLAGEQAALRRVATLVAQGVRPAEMFSAVTEAVARVIDVPAVSVVRYEEDGTATELASFSPEGQLFAVGNRWSLEGTNVLRFILESSAPARIDDYAGLEGEIAELVRRSGLRSTVGVPIVVAGRLWGAMVVSGTQQLPTQTELHLAKFTELFATAMENAESREALELLANEQAALRRVATLVAGGAPPPELFAAVAGEVGRLLPVGGATMWRFGGEGTVTTLAAWSTGEVAFPAGTQWSTEGRNVPGIVYRTGRPARLDDFSEASGPIGRRGREAGYRSAVGSPITVQGRLWGVMTAASFAEEPLPVDTESRLASFTELVATAIANAESHDAVARLAAEQAALRRVAMLVAQGVAPAEIFSSVSKEVDELFRLDVDATDVAGVIRIDPGPEFVVVGTSRTVEAVPLGSRSGPKDLYASTQVERTGRSARVDEGDLAAVGGPDAEFLRRQGFLSQVASPIVVEGCLWGAVTIDAADALPPETERRLERFGELVATAIANVESRDAAARLTKEQTALRRVAMLVAQGVPPVEIFTAVSNEVERLFRLEGDPTAVGAVIRIDPGPEFVLAGASRSVGAVPVGLKWEPKDLYASTRVLRTGHSARIDEADLDAVGGPDADFMRLHGYLSQVASPIVVEGRLWGAITMNASDVLPADTERRLERFGDLVATAIANVEAREAISRLVDEQAALRRMATLVAVGAAPNVVFDAVISEANELLPADGVALSRYEPDDEMVVVANCGLGASEAPPGTRIKHEGENVTSLVRRTGEPARLEEYEQTETSMSRLLRSLGVRAAVGAPIVVGGELWGVMLARWSEDVSPPADTEERLARFAQVVDTAIANAAARAENERLADEQAALRRVATLVAQQATAEETFAAVATETAGLFGAERGAVFRFEPEEMFAVMAYASSDDSGMPLGTRLALDGDNIVVDVWRSGQASRRDDDAQSTGAAAELRRQGAQPRSTIGVPIVVDRRPWGAIFVSTSRGDRFPAGAEQRLLDFSELVATAIANAESRSELAASRARIVTASDEARRRIERDLHDGAQQRLVSLGLELRGAADRVPVEFTELRSELVQVADGLMSALDDLRELSRGIHPAILAEAGLGPALKSLARRSLVPTEVEVSETRFPEPIEVAAYYVVSEALVNAAKHANASVVRVAAVKHGDVLHLSIRDDGLGGADPAKGSGLIGLRDRVEALDGSIDVSSRIGEGTQVVVELPVEVGTRFAGTVPDEPVASG